jgi:hypothetical protein
LLISIIKIAIFIINIIIADTIIVAYYITNICTCNIANVITICIAGNTIIFFKYFSC